MNLHYVALRWWEGDIEGIYVTVSAAGLEANVPLWGRHSLLKLFPHPFMWNLCLFWMMAFAVIRTHKALFESCVVTEFSKVFQSQPLLCNPPLLLVKHSCFHLCKISFSRIKFASFLHDNSVLQFLSCFMSVLASCHCLVDRVLCPFVLSHRIIECLGFKGP